MKICHFCGHDNPDNLTHCERCKTQLELQRGHFGDTTIVADIEQLKQKRVTERKEAQPFNAKATVRENSYHAPSTESCESKCNMCGFDLNADDEFCPNCGNQVGKVVPQSNKMQGNEQKTVRPNLRHKHAKKTEQQGFTLKLIPDIDEDILSQTIKYEGETTILNRNNTEKNNNTITLKEQAVVKWEDGKWTIEDKSNMKTTFVQAARPVELKPGDIVLLGDRLFKFDVITP